MSEYIGDPDGSTTDTTAAAATSIGSTTGAATGRTTITTPGTSPRSTTVHEAYAFACLNCGFGWEQAYEIEHRTDAQGHPVISYRANGVPVPSPLTSPGCPGCGGTHVRILRAGRVAEAAAYWHAPRPVGRSQPAPTSTVTTARPRKPRRLHLPFHFLQRRRHTTPEP